MSPESITQTVIAVLAPLTTLVGLASRRRRLRAEIREDLSLLQELKKDEILVGHTPACGWLQGRIALDVARLTGVQLGTPKKPIPKGSVALALLLACGFSYLTYYIVRNGFVWYSVFPGIVASLLFISVFGMTTNRELPPEATGDLPPGAVPVATATASERVASADNNASADGVDNGFSVPEPTEVALRFFAAMREGRFEEGCAYADQNWKLCRIQSWIWNNRDSFGLEVGELNQLAEDLLTNCMPKESWGEYIAHEARQFTAAWFSLKPDQMGAASRRRVVARDYELVILAPVGESGGYFVTAATLLPNALTFLMHYVGGRWLVANHAGSAPPIPGWPPAWWIVNDPAIEALGDASS